MAETHKRMKEEKMRASRARQRRREQEWHQQQKEQLKNFLEKHGFDPSDVNAPGARKTTCFSLMSSYQRPLHKAIQEHESEMILFLVLQGADPMLKDSKGKNAYEYCKSPFIKTRMQKLHAQISSARALQLR